MSVKAFSDPDVLEAKMTEMESWKRFEVYDEIKMKVRGILQSNGLLPRSSI